MNAENDATRPNVLPPPESREEFISIGDIARMILKHRRKIAVFVVLATAISAVFFFLSPRQYKAEGFLQVIQASSDIDAKIDQAAFETTIISHLQTIQSAFIAEEVAAVISKGDETLTAADLSRMVRIFRPPKSSLIVLTVSFFSPEKAVAVAKTWIKQYLARARKNNISVALSQVRSMLKTAQFKLMEIRAKAEQLKANAEQTRPFVELARGIEDNQLWRELSEKTSAEKLEDLSRIHIKGQEQNSEYLTVKTMLYHADQALAAAVANHDFLLDVEKYLEYKARQLENHAIIQEPQISSNAMQFADTMLKTTDVIEVGEPALKSSERGALRKTAIAFCISLVLASLTACLAEWFKTLKL